MFTVKYEVHKGIILVMIAVAIYTEGINYNHYDIVWLHFESIESCMHTMSSIESGMYVW